MDDYVLGVTSVCDELFVSLRRVRNQVAVYSINDYQLVCHINVSERRVDISYMTACVRHKCLYMSETDKGRIHRYELASGAIMRWSVPGKPLGLSVTSSCNLLVTCRGHPARLVELSADSGQYVREIVLQSDIGDLQHSVQLTTGQFVVCHGLGLREIHRVCVVGADGKVTRSYGSKCGSNVGKLNCPCHLAVDEDSQFVFVADYHNARVVLLSPTLQFVRYVSEGLPRLCQVYFHQATRRLFVGQSVRSVTVIQL